MITPQQIQTLAEPIEDVYAAIVDELMINIGRHVRAPTWTHTASWEVQKLSEMGQLTQENAAIINKWIKSMPQELRDTMEETRRAALDRLEKEMERAMKAGAVTPPVSDSVPQVLEEYAAQAADRFNLVNTNMLNSSVNMYQQAILDGKDVSDWQWEGEVKDVPGEFNTWIDNNRERAKGWSNMPYFVRDNPQYVKGFEVNTYSKAERKFTRAMRTNEAMKESPDKYLQKLYPEMPNTEKAAIYHYTQGNTSAYRQLNKQLRDGKLSEFNEAFSELLSNALQKLPPMEATVYRTIRLNKTRLRAFTEMATSGAETTFAGFTHGKEE